MEEYENKINSITEKMLNQFNIHTTSQTENKLMLFEERIEKLIMMLKQKEEENEQEKKKTKEL